MSHAPILPAAGEAVEVSAQGEDSSGLSSIRLNYRVDPETVVATVPMARRGAGFALSHAVNYLLQMATIQFFVWVGVPERLAPIPMFAICVPVNFLLVRFFLKR